MAFPDLASPDFAPWPDLPDALSQAIAAAEMRLAPFPYVVIPRLLPPELYAALLAKWPSEDCFKTTNFGGRFQLDLAKYIDADPAGPDGFWRDVFTLSGTINRALARKFDRELAQKFEPLFGPDWKTIARDRLRITFRNAQLAQYPSQSALHAHVDSTRVVTNSFLYLSERDDAEPELGTVLYRSHGLAVPENNLKLPKQWEQSFMARDVVIPYQANTLFAFVNSPRAFHGVDAFDIAPRNRRLLICSSVFVESEEEMRAHFTNRPCRIDDGGPAQS